MSLRKAIDRLKTDRATEKAVREVIELLRLHSGEHFASADVARRLGRPEALIAVVLLELADAYVLHRDGVRYAYMRDPVVELDVERFMRRTDSHDAFVQTNVAKFRDRYGYR
jgi:hypothetical protein